jgi:hypothetical protein
MKKSVLTLSLIGLAFYSYSQNEVKPNELTSPIMRDFLKNYQEKNGIQKIVKGIPFTSELSKRGIEGDRNVQTELENIDNMVIVKPNLVEILRMPNVRPDEKTHHTIRIVNSDTNKPKPTQ